MYCSVTGHVQLVIYTNNTKALTKKGYKEKIQMISKEEDHTNDTKKIGKPKMRPKKVENQKNDTKRWKILNMIQKGIKNKQDTKKVT